MKFGSMSQEKLKNILHFKVKLMAFVLILACIILWFQAERYWQQVFLYGFSTELLIRLRQRNIKDGKRKLKILKRGKSMAAEYSKKFYTIQKQSAETSSELLSISEGIGKAIALYQDMDFTAFRVQAKYIGERCCRLESKIRSLQAGLASSRETKSPSGMIKETISFTEHLLAQNLSLAAEKSEQMSKMMESCEKACSQINAAKRMEEIASLEEFKKKLYTE